MASARSPRRGWRRWRLDHGGGGFPGGNEPRRFAGHAAAIARANAAYAAAHPRTFTLVATGDVLLHTLLWDQARADAAVGGYPGGHDFRPMLAGINRW